MTLRIDISERLARDPTVQGSPTAFDLFHDVDHNLENSTYLGTCIVYDQEEPILDGNYDYYEKRGLASIISLYIRDGFRHRGFGTFLLKWTMDYLYQVGFRYAELDDASDFFGRSDNIYKKAGFNYDSDDNHMMANLRHCMVSGN